MREFMPGDVVLEPNGASLWGWGQILLLGTPFQHVAAVWFSRAEFIETGILGVRINRIPARKIDRYIIRRPKCSPEVRAQALRLMESKLGEGYGFLQLALYALGRRLGFKAPDVPRGPCWELIAWAYAEAGYDLAEGLEDDLTGLDVLMASDRLETIGA